MDYESILKELDAYDECERKEQADMVNSPSHYTQGRVEVIDVIEDSIAAAPSVVTGMLQGQVLKYILRLWHKDNAKQDAEKSLWYLKRLIEKIESECS